MRVSSISAAFLLLLAGLGYGACSGSRQPAVQQTAGMTNSELESRIRGSLDSNPDLKAARLLIDTDAGRRTVTVSGTVKSDETHSKAIEAAQTAVPGITVVDKIQVQPSDLARADQGATPPAPEEKAKGKTGKPARRRR